MWFSTNVADVQRNNRRLIKFSLCNILGCGLVLEDKAIFMTAQSNE